jgi:serine/threonine protein kinase
LIARFPGLKRPEEGEIAVTLQHPNVVRTFDWGWTLKDEQFLSMERIEGVDLTSIVHTEAKRPLNRRLSFLIDAARGLGYFHDQGYIHRDISPKNVLVNQHGIAKLIDFGLYVPNKPEFRRPGNRTGTLRYMAPELIKRNQTDHRIDIFSFGVTVYEVLSGGLPWEGGGESMQEALQHVNVEPRDPRELNPHLDRETAEVVLKAIERDPTERYQTMNAFADALETLRPKVIDESKLKGSRASKSSENVRKEPRKN